MATAVANISGTIERHSKSRRKPRCRICASPELAKTVLADRVAGASQIETAAKIGCSEQWLRIHLQRHVPAKTVPVVNKGTKRPCSICIDAVAAMAVLNWLRAGKPLAELARALCKNANTLRSHVSKHLRPYRLEIQHARQEARARERKERERAIVDGPNKFDAHEARMLMRQVGYEGRTLESVRSEITISDSDAESLAGTFGRAFAWSVVRRREMVGIAFDRLIVEGIAEKERLDAAKKRLRLKVYYKEQEAKDRKRERERAAYRRKESEASDWEV